MSNTFQGSNAFGMTLSGLRMGPMDPKKKVPRVGTVQQYYIEDPYSSKVPKFLNKERSGFSGGFKIPEEQRKRKLGRKIKHTVGDDEEHQEDVSRNEIPKDEIMQHLNLGTSQTAGGMGKHGTGTKTALSKDLIENLEKELEKLRRTEENIKVRKFTALGGDRSILDETEEQRQDQRNAAIEDEMKSRGNAVIHADEKRVQVIRHRVGQLDSVKAVSLDELETMRKATEEKLMVLQEQYWGGRQKEAGARARETQKQFGQTSDSSAAPGATKSFKGEPSPAGILKKGSTKGAGDSFKPKFDHRNLKKSKSKDGRGGSRSPSKGKGDRGDRVGFKDGSGEDARGYSDGEGRADEDNYQQDGYGDERDPARSRSRGGRRMSRSLSKSKKKKKQKKYRYGGSNSYSQSSSSSPDGADPRQQIYEAKFEKYLANKKVKVGQEKRKATAKPQDFDIYTKGPGSPSKLGKRFKTHTDPTELQFSGKYNEEDLIGPTEDDDILNDAALRKLQRTGGDVFKELGVTGVDKMTFFLLKWVFNAIKREAAEDDPKFQGHSYVKKSDLVKQLSKNPELMHALGYEDYRELGEAVKLSACKKDGFLMWAEFLDFFFLRGASLQDRMDGNDWWSQLDHKGRQIVKEDEEEKSDLEGAGTDKENRDLSNSQVRGKSGSPGGKGTYTVGKRLPERKPVKVTPSLRMLQASRATRAEREVEDEFKVMAAEKKAGLKTGGAGGAKSPAKQKEKGADYDPYDADLAGETLGFSREKSKNLMLNSQLELMREVFVRLDKHNEGILRRSDFVMALRTDGLVIEFIDCEAVKKAYGTSSLTLDAVLLEIEKDERYDEAQAKQSKQQINHKEFITWREFLSYFNDYQEIEQRNRKQSQLPQTQKILKKESGAGDDADAQAAQEITTLMEREKERRLQELPQLRQADQIDVSEKHLQLLKDIFDSIPRGAQGSKESVHVLTFFHTIRKDPQIRAINTAIARDPEGTSRVARETYQEVFDRMERELQQKHIDWPTIVEFFTKRGRPLSKDEIQKLVDEDRKEKEATEGKKRAEEEVERRRNQRAAGDAEEEQGDATREKRRNAERAAQEEEDEERLRRRGPRARDGPPASDEDEDDDYDEEDEYGDLSDDDLQRDPDMDEDGDEDGDEERTTGESEFGENLGRAKLTQQEYLKRAETAKARKKGKYGVTVPKPFGFDMRDKTRPKSIRERRIDLMVHEKRQDERAHVERQFRSKPIPPEVLIPRYHTIMEADHARRLAVRSQSVHLTKEREAPFSFWARDVAKQQQRVDPAELVPAEMRRPGFKANPIPRACSVLIFAKKVREDELKRDERVRKNAETAYAKAKMPPTMQKHADRKKQEPPKKMLDDECTFKPKTGPLVSGKMLRDKAERFHRELAKKKGQKTQTVARSPDFVQRPSKMLDRSYINEGPGQKPEDKFAAATARLAGPPRVDDAQQVNPMGTRATAMARAKRRDEIQAKKKQEEALKKAEADRKAAQDQMKGQVQSALKSKFAVTSAAAISASTAAKRAHTRKQDREAAERLQETVKKARSGPMLWERTATDNAKASNLAQLKATKKMIGLLKEHGEDPDKYLPEKAKELLEEDRLKQQLKQKYQGQR